MVRNSFAIMALTLSSILSNAQSTPKPYDEIEHLQGIIHQFMYDHDSTTYDRITEFIILFLRIDSTGNITSINIMADEKNAGPTLKAIKSLTPNDVKGWTSVNYKGKLMVMPVYCDGSLGSYLNSIGFSPVIPLDMWKTKGEYRFVITQQLFYSWPSSRGSHDSR